MKALWAPWRIDYILGGKEKECIFCVKPKEARDVENLILHRGALNFVIMNLYPYNSGHLMVVPYRHIDKMTDLTPEEGADMMEVVKKCVAVLDARFRPQGYNIGLNQMAAAGAGIDEHIHMHIVPRWHGDTNFMPAIGETKVMPQHIADTYAALAGGFSG